MPELFTATLIIILAAISPGPDFALVIKNALLHERRAGVATALGVSCSLLVHSSYCIVGLAIIISQSLLLFSIIKYIGAAYLVYIGIKSLFSKDAVNKIDNKEIKKQSSITQAFLQGFLCNLLNPKAILFILAFFTLILNPNNSWFERMSYGLEISLIHFIWFSLLAVIINHSAVKNSLSKVQRYIVKAMGIVLIGFGTKIALLTRAAL